MTIWFTSDEHYGHANIIKFCNRPFSDVHEMTLGLIAKHNHLVKKGDTVYHLGDFCWKPADVAEVLRQLEGEHILIVGNHDSCHPMHKNAEREKRRYLVAGFKDVLVEMRGVLSHSPFREIVYHHMPHTQIGRHEGRSKYQDWLPNMETRDDGLHPLLLHGHIHDARRVLGDEINVGVDVWDYAPTTIVRILERWQKGNS